MSQLSPEELARRLKTRVAKMDTDQLRMWADAAVMGMQRQMDDFFRAPDEAHLAEIILACNSMHAVCEELQIRLEQAKRLTTT